MKENRQKKDRVNYTFSKDTKIILSKIAKIESRSMSNALEVMIFEKGKEYGFIETR